MKRRTFLALTASASAWVAARTLRAAPAPPRRALAPGPSPAANPLKGFLPYAGQYDFPHSMEWFYLPLSAVQRDFSLFDWSALEAQLAPIAARGHQATFRFYLDYPSLPSGIPAFLKHVPTRTYTENGNNGVSVSPDYEHPDLRRALRLFIEAFGRRYDGDPRIGFLTIGLLGFWGEWHTWPHDDWFAPTSVQNEVLDAYQSAFSRTKLLVREPKDGTRMSERPFGFHDDSFAFQTLAPAEWHFWPKVERAGCGDRWRTQSIGGEVRPEVQGCLWNDASCAPAGQEFDRCVQTTHASWLLNQGAFADFSPKQHERALKASVSLGYEFFVPAVELPPRLRLGAPLTGRIALRNQGVAPFPYPWRIEVALRDAGGALFCAAVKGDLRSVAPGAPDAWFSFALPQRAARGRASVLVRVVNPLQSGVPLRFANATQDATLPGYLTLGEVVIG